MPELFSALEERTLVMGVLNVTPNSFYDGGQYDDVSTAVARARTMVEEGADIIDVGGESTAPSSASTPVEAEKSRVVPVIEQLRDSDTLISIDSRRPSVTEAALSAGGDIINDQNGLEDPQMRELAAEADCPVVMMDSVNLPVDPSYQPSVDDIVTATKQRLAERAQTVEEAGVDPGNLVLDPGIGFGTTSEQDFKLIARLSELAELGYPLLVGCSRKSFLTRLKDVPPEDRLKMTIAAETIAAVRGADILRVHDVAETKDLVRVANEISRVSGT